MTCIGDCYIKHITRSPPFRIPFLASAVKIRTKMCYLRMCGKRRSSSVRDSDDLALDQMAFD